MKTNPGIENRLNELAMLLPIFAEKNTDIYPLIHRAIAKIMTKDDAIKLNKIIRENIIVMTDILNIAGTLEKIL